MEEKFKPITTQEELDAAIGARLARQKESLENGFKSERESLRKTIREHEGTIGELRKAAEAFDKTKEAQEKELGKLRERVKGFERTALTERAAEAAGLSRAFAARLRGETEEELTADAKELAKLVAPPQEQRKADPGAEYGGAGGVSADWGAVLAGLRSE